MEKNAQIAKMLHFLKRRDDCHFDAFCNALTVADQKGVVDRFFQKHRVCCYAFCDIIAKL